MIAHYNLQSLKKPFQLDANWLNLCTNKNSFGHTNQANKKKDCFRIWDLGLPEPWVMSHNANHKLEAALGSDLQSWNRGHCFNIWVRLPLGRTLVLEQGIGFQYLSQEICALCQLQTAPGPVNNLGTGVMVLKSQSGCPWAMHMPWNWGYEIEAWAKNYRLAYRL